MVFNLNAPCLYPNRFSSSWRVVKEMRREMDKGREVVVARAERVEQALAVEELRRGQGQMAAEVAAAARRAADSEVAVGMLGADVRKLGRQLHRGQQELRGQEDKGQRAAAVGEGGAVEGR